MKIPRVKFTIGQGDINNMIQDLSGRIGIQFGTPKIIDEPDPEDPDTAVFSKAWRIRYAVAKVYDPGSMLTLQTPTDILILSVLKKYLGEKFDVRCVPYYAYLAGIDESTSTPTPRLRKIEVTMIFPQTHEQEEQIRSGCKKEGRTFHSEEEKTNKLALGLTFVKKDECPCCNFPIDPSTFKFIYVRTCPVPGCGFQYPNRRECEKKFLRTFDLHDCEKELHKFTHMATYRYPELPDVCIETLPSAEQLSRNVTESLAFAVWKTHIDKQAAEQTALSVLRAQVRATSVTKPHYQSPKSTKSALPRPGFKRAKRPN